MILEMTPKCYYAHYDGVDELPKEVGGIWSYMWRMLPHNKPEKGIMILEDITKSPGRFRHLDKNKVPDIEKFLKVMESIAHFHGTWWQVVDDLRGRETICICHLKYRYVHHYCFTLIFSAERSNTLTPMKFEKFKTHFQHKWGPYPMLKNFAKTFVLGLARLLENRGLHPELGQNILKYDTRPAMKKIYDKESPFTTIVHGDLWINNFMMSEDGEHVKLIDFGNVFMSHPVYDIMYFLYMNTDREFRKKHEEEILQAYFATFSKYLRRSVDLGFEQFKREVAERREGVMLVGMLVSSRGNTGSMKPNLNLL